MQWARKFCVGLPQKQLPAPCCDVNKCIYCVTLLLLIFALTFLGLYPVWVSLFHNVLWHIYSDGFSLPLSSLLLGQTQRFHWYSGSGTNAIRVRKPTAQTLLCTLISFVCVCVCARAAHALVLIPVGLHQRRCVELYPDFPSLRLFEGNLPPNPISP